MIEAHAALGPPLPVNIKLIYEGLEEYGSTGMREAIVDEFRRPGGGGGSGSGFLADVDYYCISDNYWLGKNKPCLTYGLRGMAYFEVGVEVRGVRVGG